MTITIPFPPTTGNHQHVTLRNGRRMLRKDIIAWRDEVSYLVSQMKIRFLTLAPLSMHVDVWMPDNRKRDLDNIAKVVSDALEEAGMILDDSSVHDLHLIKKGVDKIAPRCIISIERLNG